jgi:DNA-binding YbaB/EbfC family protein
MDMNKMMQQVQQLQAQMAQAQEELKNETVEASAGGGMVTVKATGDLQITEIKISPDAIDPDDPEMLSDMVLAAVNEALRSAQALAQSKLGGMAGLGDLGGMGLPGSSSRAAPATRGAARRAHRGRPARGRPVPRSISSSGSNGFVT